MADRNDNLGNSGRNSDTDLNRNTGGSDQGTSGSRGGSDVSGDELGGSRDRGMGGSSGGSQSDREIGQSDGLGSSTEDSNIDDNRSNR